MVDEVNTPQTEIIIDQSIDQMMEQMPVGSLSKAIGNNLYGINFRQTGSAVPRTKDVYGFTFFTRPQLNLTRFNITNYRGFYNLLTDNEVSYQRYTRMMLDPRLGFRDVASSALVDNFNPFIPILTNNIVSLSGWPDLMAPTYTSHSGLYGQEHSFVDGVTNHFEAFDMDITFKNTKGNPLIYLFYVWLKYETLVFEGIMTPYLDMITENEIDYNTRIYRLVLDQQKRYITFIAATGASFPVSVPVGNLFDYNTDTPFNTRNNEINIRFRNIGFTAFEDILKLEFNKTTAIFNPDIRALLKYDTDSSVSDKQKLRDDAAVVYRVPGCNYVKIPFLLATTMDLDITSNSFFSVNYRAYPYINLLTNELEWWVDEKRFGSASSTEFKKTIEKNGLPVNDETDIEEQEPNASDFNGNSRGDY